MRPMSSTPRTPILLLVNPGSGGKVGAPAADGDPARRDPDSLAAALRAGGLTVRMVILEPDDDPGALAADAVARGEDVVVAGGDGTVGPAAAAIASVANHATTLGIIPLGSFNNVARGSGIPLEPDQAIAVDIAGRSALLDAGAVWTLERMPEPGAPAPTPPESAQLFFEAAGVGLDADGFGAARAGERRGLRFAARAAWHAMRRRATPLILSVDGSLERVASPAVTICNGPYHGYGFALAPEADPTDGQLEVVVFSHMSRLGVVRHFMRVAFGRPRREARVQIRRARLVLLHGEQRELPAHADGRPACTTPLAVAVRPGALRLFR
jgi:diacylglycerol kinase (ATP)